MYQLCLCRLSCPNQIGLLALILYSGTISVVENESTGPSVGLPVADIAFSEPISSSRYSAAVTLYFSDGRVSFYTAKGVYPALPSSKGKAV